MSLYNSLFGTNKLAPLLMSVLNLEPAQVPRFRDCYTNGEHIIVYTRTGGGNRDYYESEESCRNNYPECFTSDEGALEEIPSGPWNSDLRALPTFVKDCDDHFDSTYAYFYFEFPEKFASILNWLKANRLETTQSPTERFQALLTDLNSNADNPDVARALAVGEQIFSQLKDDLKEESSTNQ